LENSQVAVLMITFWRFGLSAQVRDVSPTGSVAVVAASGWMQEAAIEQLQRRGISTSSASGGTDMEGEGRRGNRRVVSALPQRLRSLTAETPSDRGLLLT